MEFIQSRRVRREGIGGEELHVGWVLVLVLTLDLAMDPTRAARCYRHGQHVAGCRLPVARC